MKKELICIVCPNGCQLAVEKTPQGLVIKGNRCPKGEAYGREETTDPRRMVTAVVRTGSQQWPCVPVRTSAPVPKALVRELLDELYALVVLLPMNRGDTVIADFRGTGTGVVVTRTVPPREPAP